jgi:hypothetical protein
MVDSAAERVQASAGAVESAIKQWPGHPCPSRPDLRGRTGAIRGFPARA